MTEQTTNTDESLLNKIKAAKAEVSSEPIKYDKKVVDGEELITSATTTASSP